MTKIYLDFNISVLDINAVVETMISRNYEGQWECSTCGKEFKTKQMAQRHAEIHLNITHQCIVCQKGFKTRNSLSVHYSQTHKNQVDSPWSMQ